MVPREKYVEGAQTPLTTFKDIKKSEIWAVNLQTNQSNLAVRNKK